MISRKLEPFLVHLKVRAIDCLRNPTVLAFLLIFGGTALILWPGAAADPFADFRGGLDPLLFWFLWLWLWPMAPVLAVRGRATAVKGEAPLGVVGAPALPVGPKTRSVAEVTLALAVLVLIRSILASFLYDSSPALLLREGLVGAIFLFPLFLAWTLPSRNPATFMARPLAVALIATAAHRLFETTGSTAGLFVAAGVLTVAVVLTAGIDVPEYSGGRAKGGRTARCRDAVRPASLLTRDAALPLVKRWGPWMAAAVLVYLVAVVLDARGFEWKWTLFAGFEIFLIACLMALLRPFNSNLVAESLAGKHGVSRGDFLRAWAFLPVEPAAVLRRVWLHGILVTTFIWLVPLMMLNLRHRLATGAWSFADALGDLGQFFVGGACFVPMVAGFLVAVAAGSRRDLIVAGFSLLVGIHGLFLIKILLEEMFGSESIQALAGTVLLLVALVAAGSLPPLRFLTVRGRSSLVS